MSRTLCCIKLSTEAFFRTQRCLRSALSAKKTQVLRGIRHNATAAAFQPEEDVGYLDGAVSSERRDRVLPYPRASRRTADPTPLVDHLQGLFPPLQFPPVVAKRMLTHISAREAPWEGHNARLAFVGRRVLQSYLFLFLDSVPTAQLPKSYEPDYAFIASRALHTALLGEHVGMQWNLNKVMLWTPSKHFEGILDVEDRRKHPEGSLVSKGVGFNKILGTTVEGIMGGIFHQFGGSIAHRVFHTRLLPHIMCPGSPVGVPDQYHKAAIERLRKMGGRDVLLASANNRLDNSSRVSSLIDSNKEVLPL